MNTKKSNAHILKGAPSWLESINGETLEIICLSEIYMVVMRTECSPMVFLTLSYRAVSWADQRAFSSAGSFHMKDRAQACNFSAPLHCLITITARMEWEFLTREGGLLKEIQSTTVNYCFTRELQFCLYSLIFYSPARLSIPNNKFPDLLECGSVCLGSWLSMRATCYRMIKPLTNCSYHRAEEFLQEPEMGSAMPLFSDWLKWNCPHK